MTRISYNGTCSEDRRNTRAGRHCDYCAEFIPVGDMYIHSVMFPFQEFDFHVSNWHIGCIPDKLFNEMNKKMENK